MAKKSSGGKGLKNPPPKKSTPVKRPASKSSAKLGGLGFVKELVASVVRRIEPRKGPRGK